MIDAGGIEKKAIFSPSTHFGRNYHYFLLIYCCQMLMRVIDVLPALSCPLATSIYPPEAFSAALSHFTAPQSKQIRVAGKRRRFICQAANYYRTFVCWWQDWAQLTQNSSCNQQKEEPFTSTIWLDKPTLGSHSQMINTLSSAQHLITQNLIWTWAHLTNQLATELLFLLQKQIAYPRSRAWLIQLLLS